MPVRRGPMRFSVEYSSVSPRKIPIIADRARTDTECKPRVRQLPVATATTMRTQETIPKRMRLNLKAPKARVGVVDKSPPKDQHRAAVRAEHSAIYMELLPG